MQRRLDLRNALQRPVDVNIFLRARAKPIAATRVRIEVDDEELEEKIVDLLAGHEEVIWFDPDVTDALEVVVLDAEPGALKIAFEIIDRAPSHEVDTSEPESVVLLRNLIKAASDVVEHKEAREIAGLPDLE